MTARASAAPRGAALQQTRVYMDTFVSIEVVGAADEDEAGAAIGRAFGWFEEVERTCSRFDPASELRQLCATAGETVSASPLLFQAVEFAVAMARESGGAFDPAIGAAMERNGFSRNYRTGKVTAARPAESIRATFRDIVLDARRRQIRLNRPMQIDLGAVAKGFAIDLAARELSAFPGVAVSAGGDIFVRGRNASGKRWRIGVKDPRNPAEVLDVLQVAEGAVCTSGDYERTHAKGHHILRPATGESAGGLVSATVVAPTAMLADALATAAFVLGPRDGLALVERVGAHCQLMTPALERFETRGFSRYRK